MSKPNTLIVIGFLGLKKCYLNVSKEEAIQRWEKSNPGSSVTGLSVLEFDDEFECYDAWE